VSQEGNYIYRRAAEPIENNGKSLPRSFTGHHYSKKTDSVVIMSLQDYSALEETAYLLRSLKNTRRLIESIVPLGEEKGTERELIE
jgi:hypothetical protein